MKALIVILLSTFKFGMTFPLAIMEFHFGFLEAVLWTNLGGILGICLFAYLSELILKAWSRHFPANPHHPKQSAYRFHLRKQKPLFCKRNRRIAAIKSNYGLPGVAIATPILLSIPVGTFIVVRYFRHRRLRLVYMFVSNLLWSFAYASFYGFCNDVYRHAITAL